MKEIAVDILLCTVDRQRTLMKGDKVVELLEKCTNLLLLSVSGNHNVLCQQLIFSYAFN